MKDERKHGRVKGNNIAVVKQQRNWCFLKIDVDKKDKRDFMRRYQALYRYFRFNLVDYEISETRKGYHIRLIIDFPFKVTS